MNLTTTTNGDGVVEFKCDPEYHRAVVRGEKTAEVRLLSRSEIADLRVLRPAYLLLTDIQGGNERFFPLSYHAEIGELLGNTLVLFCWRVVP